ncbi:MAG: 6-bladed beta-propeller [Methanospirillum sp.]
MRSFNLICIFVIMIASVQAVAAAETYVYSTQWGKVGGGAGAGVGEFNEPARIAFDTAGNVFVDDMSNNRIQKFDPVGTFLTTWGSEGVADPPSAPGTFLSPMGVAVDSMDYLYVADRMIHRVQVMDPDQLWSIFGPSGPTELLQPSDVAVDSNDNLYTVDWGHDRIRVFDIYGTPIGMWGTTGSGNGDLSGPRGIAIDGADNVYVADTGNSRIQKFTLDGTYVTQWGAPGTDAGNFTEPWGVGTDATGNVYVADTGNNRVQKFDANGAYLATIGGPGTGNGQFTGPYDVSVNSTGTVFVADTGNNRVQLFDQGPAVLAVPPETALPTDTNGDGLYDDVNGNGRADFADVVLYFNQLSWIAANEPLAPFDYNANGRIDFGDVVWLFNTL